MYCPTGKMLADFFTKPLQGKLFKYLRNIVMGLAPFPMEERVGFYENGQNKSIVEECTYDVDKIQSLNNKLTYADIVLKNEIKTDIVVED